MRLTKIAFLLAAMVCIGVHAENPDGTGQAEPAPLAKKLAIAEVVYNRDLVIQDILGRSFLATTGNLSDVGELEATLKRISDGRLADAWLAADARELEVAVLGSPLGLDAGGLQEKLLGEATTDLVYNALSQPCRLFDSRSDSRGPMTANETRNFAVQGFQIGNQGGNVSLCPEVPFDPPAIVITLTAVEPQGTGNARVWPANNPTPFVSHISYRNGVNLSNSTVTSVCQNCGTWNDINVRVQNAQSQVIGDIIGWFERPEGCAPGTTEIAGHCYQTSLRAANTSVFQASNDCVDENGRLPSVGELLLALDTLTGAAAGEYTDSIYYDDPLFRVLLITSASSLVDENTLFDAQYRCVFDLFDFN